MADHSRPVTGYPAPPTYPYSAQPPPHPTSNYYYPPQPPYPSPRAVFLRRITTVFIASLVVSGTIVLIAWIILRPRAPTVSLSSLSLSSFNLSSSLLLTATWLSNLTVSNPNSKFSLSYDAVQASLSYRSDPLATTSLPPFDQPSRNSTSFSAGFAVVGGYVEGKTGDAMREERREKAGLLFNFRLLARVRFRDGGWIARSRLLRVYCKGLFVSFSGNSSSGSMSGGPRQCRVGL